MQLLYFEHSKEFFYEWRPSIALLFFRWLPMHF
jgi:hypothetical protein